MNGPPSTSYKKGGTEQARYGAADVMTWPCPLCGDERTTPIKTERGVLAVVRCVRCDLIRVSPRLRAPDAVYRGDPAIYEEEFRLVREGRARHHRDDNYEADRAILARYKPRGALLDVGTNAGSFLRLLLGHGWTLQGVEPSPVLAELARRWWGLDVINAFLEEAHLPSAAFDVVTMTDVLEHVVNPKAVLGEVRRVLKPDGILFVKVPNARWNLLKHAVRRLQGRAAGSDDFDAYEHVVHYTDDTLAKMLRSAGFTMRVMFVDRPVQIPVWHAHVGHYYQHASPWRLDWQRRSARDLAFWLARLERRLVGRIGALAPAIACIAEPAVSA